MKRHILSIVVPYCIAIGFICAVLLIFMGMMP